jgi:hypothetical protein
MYLSAGSSHYAQVIFIKSAYTLLLVLVQAGKPAYRQLYTPG